MNHLGQNLEGKIVELKESLFKKELRDIKYRLVRVTGGSGASCNVGVSGTKIFFKHICDGEEGMCNEADIVRVVGE